MVGSRGSGKILEIEDDDELRERMTEHARDVASELAWGIDEWDVINHPVKMDGVWRDRFDSDPSAWVEWLNAAREGDPEATLFVNEAAFRNDEETEGYRERYYDMIEYLLEEDAAVDGLGFMGHFSPETLVPPEEALERLDRFAEFDLEIQFTEYDFADDWSEEELPTEQAEQLQADYTRDFYIYTFSHPAVTSVITWGIWEPTHWRDDAAFFREDWSTRPHHDVYKELVFDTWWTKECGETDSEGTYETRGFKGEYVVDAVVDGETRTATVTVDDDRNVVEL
ncbi:endo-1,4-beta-xylanase [Halocatena marina]|uniref:endo-1,4-beta-xylanase n=1 Tax=Halocatena marina TaxID=2934937 RepID=UPI00222ED783|nr:endo-1,4-beta-xylanase [Halocatena marina]